MWMPKPKIDPTLVDLMREYVKEANWDDVTDDPQLTNEEVIVGIQNNYVGGVVQFIDDANNAA